MLVKNRLSREFLQTEYIDNGKSTLEIAADLKTRAENIRNALNRFDIPMRSYAEARKARSVKKQGCISTLTDIEKRLMELVTGMEPLENLLTGMTLEYDSLKMRRAELKKKFKNIHIDTDGFEMNI